MAMAEPVKDLLGFRYRPLEPDFRRDPKTAIDCALCQKDIKGEPRFFAHMVHGCFGAVHKDDRAIADEVLQENENYGILTIGSECAKKIGADYLYTVEDAPKGITRRQAPTKRGRMRTRDKL